VLQGGAQITIAGSAAIVFKGAWASTTNYVPNDAVTYAGSFYIALANNTNVVPGTDATKWAVTTSAGLTSERMSILFATCLNTTAFLAIDQPTSNFPAAACITGTNTQKAVADFDGATDESLQTTLRLPSNFNGTVDVSWDALTTANSGSVGLCVQLVCTDEGETDDPAFPAQGAGNCVSVAVPGTANQRFIASDTAITATGCEAGELAHLRFSRDADGSAVTDNVSANDLRAIGIELTLGLQ
jgi:hypothetical protein